MASPESEIQGVAGYFEYQSPNTEIGLVIQLLITPEGYTPTMQRVPPRCFFRSLNKYHTRPTWKSRVVNLEQIDFDDTDSVFKELGNTLNRVTIGEYKQVERPLLLEISQKDMTSIVKGKLPTRVSNKVKSMRQAHGYPEDLVNVTDKQEVSE